jgi:hypothetical protein
MPDTLKENLKSAFESAPGETPESQRVLERVKVLQGFLMAYFNGDHWGMQPVGSECKFKVHLIPSLDLWHVCYEVVVQHVSSGVNHNIIKFTIPPEGYPVGLTVTRTGALITVTDQEQLDDFIVKLVGHPKSVSWLRALRSQQWM